MIGQPEVDFNLRPAAELERSPVSRFCHDWARSPAAVSKRNTKNGDCSSTCLSLLHDAARRCVARRGCV